jgi:beta-glucosidase
MRFPAGFLWGTSTSAYQIEGSVDADGRGTSIWDTFSRTPGRTRNGDTGDVACDHYRRLDADLDLIVELGAPAYRFSVSWARVQPAGKGPANPLALDFYRRLVDGLRARGLLPMVTLYHWDMPQSLEDEGGWVERDTASRFADYAALVAGALGDSVHMWLTLNEPWCSAWDGYGSGRHAPGVRSVGKAVAASHHLLLAHGQAVQVLRQAASAGLVGIALNPTDVRAPSDHPDDLDAVRRVDGNRNRLFTDPLLTGHYPPDVLDDYAACEPGFSVVADGDLEVIAEPMDFLGVNYYHPRTVASAARVAEAKAAGYCVPPPEHPDDPVAEHLGAVAVHRPELPQTEMRWEVDPSGLRQILERLHHDYPRLPLYVTENGAACDDYMAPDGQVRDLTRISYLRDHLDVIGEAIDAGIDVRGYFVWSLLDNFEWSMGYSRRFGLVWVDYPTGERTPKASFEWYRQTAAANAIMPLPDSS